MACNRDPSTDGSTSSAPGPICQTSDACVPCCNSNCRFFGCAATMNLCSKCYSEHLLKEGTGAFLNKACDADPPVESPDARSHGEGADEAHGPHFQTDSPGRSIADVSSVCDSAVKTPSADASVQILRSTERTSLRTKMMRTPQSVSDLSTVFGLIDTSSSLVDTAAKAVDLPQQRIPSPLSLSPACPDCVSLPGAMAARQVETKLSLPPLVPARHQAVSRCLACRKRVGLLGFKCRCGDIFCAMHRYSDKHNCSFDYKAAGRAAIARENPVVKANKIERI